MGTRDERARAWRGVGAGALLAVLATLATVALAVAIPTQGENPRAWGIIVCGVVAVLVSARLAARNWRRLRHYRGDDLPEPQRRTRARRRPPNRPVTAKARAHPRPRPHRIQLR
ncbi:hypothetical protein [Leifsonia sp. NPDC080035]|uniref:Uncharacterized protein n=1 Tax=Leifsonia sp. NPDC080035 TaxID=3143936 RepID=A0AAU7GIW9_9MICO